MANICFGSVTYRSARERPIASALWTVEDKDNTSLIATCRVEDEQGCVALYCNEDQDQPVRIENNPQPWVWCLLEVVIGSDTFSDLMHKIDHEVYQKQGYQMGEYEPFYWYRLFSRDGVKMHEGEYQDLLEQMKSYVEET